MHTHATIASMTSSLTLLKRELHQQAELTPVPAARIGAMPELEQRTSLKRRLANRQHFRVYR